MRHLDSNDCVNDPRNQDGQPSIAGRLVGWASTKGISPGRRWRELFYYQTASGRLVCHSVDRTDEQGEPERHSVFVVSDQATGRSIGAHAAPHQ